MQIRKTIYKDGISCKWDNRRVNVRKNDNGFDFQFQIMDHDYKPHAKCYCLRNKVAVTQFSLTKEAAEIMVHMLLDLIGDDGVFITFQRT